MIAVLGATGRLGQMLRRAWGPEGALWLGRDLTDLGTASQIVDLRGILPGRGDLSQNLDLARSLLDAAPPAARIFLPSSAAVYGRHPAPLTEDIAAPETDYGRVKLAIEELAARHPRRTVALRIGNIAGADAILGDHHPGFALDCFPNGRTPRRSYMGPETFARALRDLTACPTLPGVLNLACPAAVEMGALLDAAGLDWTPRPALPGAIADVTLDTSRLETLVSFGPECQTPDGIVAEWQRTLPK